MNNNKAIIIPTLNPTIDLIDYVEELLTKGFPYVVIVNDGSKRELNYIFQRLSKLERTIVLNHDKNRGKGQGLKTAFHYCLTHLSDIDGVITVDSDGQHTIKDVCHIAEEFSKFPTDLILGVRNFSEPDIPKKSYVGNRISSDIFNLFFNKRLADTQTGLRAIPLQELDHLVALKGERYEYEINMLIYAIKRKVQIHEVPIQTVYFNNNSGSYYNAIKDSVKILKQMVSNLINFNHQYNKTYQKFHSQVSDTND